MNDPSAAAGAVSPFEIQVEVPETWKRVLKVAVSRPHFDQEYARRLHKAVKQHQRPGFRKGKTPVAMVERELGDQLRAQTLEQLVPQAFKAAIVEHDIVPITDPVLENLVFEPEMPVSFDLTIEVRPRITARDFDGLPVSERPSKVGDADVDGVLERLRESRAVFETVDRPAAEGDQVVLDLTPLAEDGQPDLARRADDQRMEVGAETNFPAFNEQIGGAAAGEERRVLVAYPDDHQNRELRGRTVTFLCQLKEVQQKVTPELDDAFAGRFGAGKTLLELRQEIRRDLLQEEQERIRREMEEQLVDALIERNEVEVPPSLVENYLTSGLEELHGRNAQVGRSNSAEEDDRYRQLTRPVAERVLKGMFIMEAIRRQENIRVTEEEVQERIAEIAREHGLDLQKYREYASRGSERDRIEHGLEERKTFDFLLSRAALGKVGAAEE